MRAVAYLLGECGLHGGGCARRCCLSAACSGGCLWLVMRSFEMLGWAGIASAANRGRVDGRLGFWWVLRFERVSLQGWLARQA